MDISFAIASLNARFGIPDVATVVAGNGDLAKVVVTAPSGAGDVSSRWSCHFVDSPDAQARFSIAVRVRSGRMAAQFVVVCPSASLVWR
jgi:hypothetical protein